MAQLREDTATLEILAATDPKSFGFALNCAGLRMSAVRDRDPLVKSVMREDVDAVALMMGGEEDAVELDSYQRSIKELGEDYGYVIAPILK